MNWFKSLMFKTTDGLFVHLTKVDEISHAPFKDAAGLANALTTELDAAQHLWFRIGEDIHSMELKDPYNAASVGVQHDDYSGYNSMPTEERIARKIVDAWAILKFKEHKDFYKNERELGDY